jgi:hypothetical protein
MKVKTTSLRRSGLLNRETHQIPETGVPERGGPRNETEQHGSLMPWVVPGGVLTADYADARGTLRSNKNPDPFNSA